MSTTPQPLRATLLPPFAAEQSLLASNHIVPPAVVRQAGELVLCTDDVHTYLEAELKTPKLDKIYNHLWLAGLPRPARSLHRQKLLKRKILITENPDEHLVWHESRIFVKPIPELLLSYDRWMKDVCVDHDLHKCACGLLLSYTWLVCHRSDFRIAKELGLLPEEVEWSNWISFVDNFLNHVDQHTLQQVSRRYRFGELRLSRLHSLYFTCSVTMPPKQVQIPQLLEDVSPEDALEYRFSTIRPKKFYADMVGVVAPLATFAGGLTLATQFIIQCPDSRLQALLALASQLFLASPLGCLLIYVLLYGFDDKEYIQGQRRTFVIAQFFIVALFMLMAFMILSVAIMVAGKTSVGINGIILLGLVIIGCLFAAGAAWTTGTLGVPGETRTWGEIFAKGWEFATCHQKRCKDLHPWIAILLLIAFILEIVEAFMLLGLGSTAAADARFQRGCKGTVTTYPWPTPVPVSEAGGGMACTTSSDPSRTTVSRISTMITTTTATSFVTKFDTHPITSWKTPYPTSVRVLK